ADRVATGIVESREALVHERDIAILIIVAGFEIAPLQQPRADRGGIVRTDLIVHRRRIRRGAWREPLHPHRRLRLRSAEDPALRIAHADDARNPAEARGELLHDRVTLASGV